MDELFERHSEKLFFPGGLEQPHSHVVQHRNAPLDEDDRRFGRPLYNSPVPFFAFAKLHLNRAPAAHIARDNVDLFSPGFVRRALTHHFDANTFSVSPNEFRFYGLRTSPIPHVMTEVAHPLPLLGDPELLERHAPERR